MMIAREGTKNKASARAREFSLFLSTTATSTSFSFSFSLSRLLLLPPIFLTEETLSFPLFLIVICMMVFLFVKKNIQKLHQSKTTGKLWVNGGQKI